MARGLRIPPDLVIAVHNIYSQVSSYAKVAAAFKKPLTWVRRIIKNYDGITGEPRTLHRKRGPKRKTTEDEDHLINAYVKNNRKASGKTVTGDLKDLQLLGNIYFPKQICAGILLSTAGASRESPC
jgi:hypothetical protein